MLKPNLQIIKHRQNQSAALQDIDSTYGVEIDLRSDVSEGGRLHLSHDPGVRGEWFDEWLDEFVRLKISGPILLNTKEDGLENGIIELLKWYNLSNWFFLDTTLPTLVRLSVFEGQSHFAHRYSRFEPMEFSQRFSGHARWLWVDCFRGEVTEAMIEDVKKLSAEFKICLVSPELQTQNADDILSYPRAMMELGDAVCTKRPDLWLAQK